MSLQIINSRVGTTTATAEDNSFPVANMATEYKSEVFKATGSESTITVNVTSNNTSPITAGGLYLGGTNAWRAVVRLYDDLGGSGGSGGLQATTTEYIGDVTTLTGHTIYSTDTTVIGVLDADVYNITINTGITLEITESQDQDAQMWHDNTRMVGDYSFERDLSSKDAILEVGVLRAGSVSDFRSPSWGLQESEVDTSIRSKLASSAEYVRQKTILRKFDGSFDIDPGDVYTWKNTINKSLFNGVPVRLFDTTERGIVYGRLQGPSTLNMSTLNLQQINFSILESV